MEAQKNWSRNDQPSDQFLQHRLAAQKLADHLSQTTGPWAPLPQQTPEEQRLCQSGQQGPEPRHPAHLARPRTKPRKEAAHSHPPVRWRRQTVPPGARRLPRLWRIRLRQLHDLGGPPQQRPHPGRGFLTRLDHVGARGHGRPCRADHDRSDRSRRAGRLGLSHHLPPSPPLPQLGALPLAARRGETRPGADRWPLPVGLLPPPPAGRRSRHPNPLRRLHQPPPTTTWWRSSARSRRAKVAKRCSACRPSWIGM